MLRPAALALALTALPGCGLMQGLNPTTRLSDQVYQLNDEARWGRLDLAQQRCGRAYRTAFMARHARWGGQIHVADADVTNLTIGEPVDGASSVVTYQWVDERTMELFATSVRQVWRGEDDGFRLVSEEVIGGERRLFVDVPVTTEEAGAEGENTATATESVASVATAGGESPPDAPSSAREPSATASVRRDAQGVRID